MPQVKEVVRNLTVLLFHLGALVDLVVQEGDHFGPKRITATDDAADVNDLQASRATITQACKDVLTTMERMYSDVGLFEAECLEV